MSMWHVTKDGERLLISDMEDDHLINTLRMFERWAEEGLVISLGGTDLYGDPCYDEEVLKGEEALEFLDYSEYVAEATRRNLSWRRS